MVRALSLASVRVAMLPGDEALGKQSRRQNCSDPSHLTRRPIFWLSRLVAAHPRLTHRCLNRHTMLKMAWPMVASAVPLRHQRLFGGESISPSQAAPLYGFAKAIIGDSALP